MKIKLTSTEPPHPYGMSSILDDPGRELDMDQIISRIQRFNRDGMINMGSKILWYAWNNHQRTELQANE